MNALDFMLGFESDCLRFYETLGKDERDPGRRGLYELLAASQKAHLSKIEAVRETASDDDVDSPLVDRAGHVINGCRQILYAHDIMKELKNDQDAFTHVVHAEQEMINLCEGMARAESRETARSVLGWLAENEKRHLEEIEEIYDFVESPHCYLEWGEFSNLHSL